MEEERKLATIRRIKEIRHITDANNIELAIVDGWQCIVKKNEFKVDDLCIYCEVDSFLPIHEEFEFLRKSSYKKLVDGVEGFRLKTMKMRGVISQGLLLPLTILNKFKLVNEPHSILFTEYGFNIITGYFEVDKYIGDDISSYLGITKYDSDSQVSFSGNAKGSFPAFILKTDEERIQNIPDIIEKYKDEIFYYSEKLNGCSFTCYLKDGEFGVCSRNLELKEELEKESYGKYWDTAKKLNLKEKLSKLSFNASLQGELIGPGIQGNPYKLYELEIRFFNLYDIDRQAYIEYDDFIWLIEHMFDIETVPILGTTTLSEIQNSIGKGLMESLIEFADGDSIFSSGKKNNIKREGLVFRSVEEKTDIVGMAHGRLSFKIISNEYLLKEK
jgi:RNA ligase (TIGR02306 family)